MRLNDLPLPIIVTIDFSAVPAGLFITGVRDVVEGQYSQLAVSLHIGIEQFEAVEVNLAPDDFVVLREGLQPIDAPFLIGVEVDHVRCTDLDEAGRVTVPPALQGGALQRDDRFGYLLLVWHFIFSLFMVGCSMAKGL
jgi:hypothetical protein